MAATPVVVRGGQDRTTSRSTSLLLSSFWKLYLETALYSILLAVLVAGLPF